MEWIIAWILLLIIAFVICLLFFYKNCKEEDNLNKIQMTLTMACFIMCVVSISMAMSNDRVYKSSNYYIEKTVKTKYDRDIIIKSDTIFKIVSKRTLRYK